MIVQVYKRIMEGDDESLHRVRGELSFKPWVQGDTPYREYTVPDGCLFGKNLEGETYLVPTNHPPVSARDLVRWGGVRRPEEQQHGRSP